jgi:hypothetical protein
MYTLLKCFQHIQHQSPRRSNMSNKMTWFFVISFIVAESVKGQPHTEKLNTKGQLKGPLFEDIQPSKHHQGRSVQSKEVDGRNPIDEDKTIRQLIFPGKLTNEIIKFCDLKIYTIRNKMVWPRKYCNTLWGLWNISRN